MITSRSLSSRFCRLSYGLSVCHSDSVCFCLYRSLFKSCHLSLGLSVCRSISSCFLSVSLSYPILSLVYRFVCPGFALLVCYLPCSRSLAGFWFLHGFICHCIDCIYSFLDFVPLTYFLSVDYYLPFSTMSFRQSLSFLCRSWYVCLSLGMTPFLTRFSNAPSHLHKRVCPSVRPSVRPSGRRSVTLSLRCMLGASSAV